MKIENGKSGVRTWDLQVDSQTLYHFARKPRFTDKAVRTDYKVKDPRYIHSLDENGHVLVTLIHRNTQGRLKHLFMCQSGPGAVDCANVTER